MFDKLKETFKNGSRLAKNDAANIGAGVIAIIGITVAVLVFAAVGPSIATGLNSTKAAFTGYQGVDGIVNVLPIVLVVTVLLFLFLRK